MRRPRLLALAVIATLAAVTASAQPAPAAAPTTPAPVRKAKKSPATLGSPREEEGAPPSRRSADRTEPANARCSDADTALARGLLHAFEPAPTEIRVIAIEDLGLLGDARALNPLAQLLFDANPSIQLAALRAISQFQTNRAEEILQNVVRHPQMSERIKLGAINSLVLQRSASTREFLARLSTATSSGSQVVSAAKKALQEWGPAPTK